jgi:hypothetical protein
MNTNIPLLDESPPQNLINICLVQDINKNQNEDKSAKDKENQTCLNNNNPFNKNLQKEYQANGSMLFMY